MRKKFHRYAVYARYPEFNGYNNWNLYDVVNDYDTAHKMTRHLHIGRYELDMVNAQRTNNTLAAFQFSLIKYNAEVKVVSVETKDIIIYPAIDDIQ